MSKQTNGNPEMPELLVDLSDKTARILRDRLDMDADVAAHVGSELAREMADSWGGQMVYIPQGLGAYRHERDEQIWREFNGTNYDELARKYKISLQWVYRIIKKMRDMRFKKAQPDLFEEQ